MDSTVHTGQTKSTSGISLVSLSFTSREKEKAVLLLHVRAASRDAKVLEDESAAIIQNSLLATEGESWHRLDGTLKELNGLFKGFLMSQTIEEIHAVVGLLDTSGTLHAAQAGRGEVYLIRGGATSQITEAMRGKPSPVFVHISSGPLEPGDAVVFSSQRLLRSLTTAQLAQTANRGDQILREIAVALDGEREQAALAAIQLTGGRRGSGDEEELPSTPPRRAASAGRQFRKQSMFASLLPALQSKAKTLLSKRPELSLPSSSRLRSQRARASAAGSALASTVRTLRESVRTFTADLRHPQRKRRAHLLLVASALVAFLVLWIVVQLFITAQRSKSNTELGQLVSKITAELKTVDNLRLIGDNEKANALLQLAEQQAKQVINSGVNSYRSEGLTLRDRIVAKKEEINNIVRISPRVVVNLASKSADITAQGMVGISDGEFVVYDRQNWYHVLLNSLEDGKKLSDEELIIDGASFPRYKSQVFLTTGNSVIELVSGQPVSMKTEDAKGWVTGKDAETYLRFLYVLSSDNKIYKYERLSGRYGTSVQYNINGDLSGALDMAIDGSVYVLKDKGTVVKLFRGEAQPFTIRHGPEDVLKDTTKLFKVTERNFYFLDPLRKRIVVTTDGGASGESSYAKQYVLEGEIGKLQDLYIDPDEAHLYVMDEKKVYVVDLGTR